MATFLTPAVPRKSTYTKADDAAAGREERLARLKTELREHIRFLSDYELLSTDWLRMAESMHQIANVAFMETSLPLIEENPLTHTGKKTTGTLWDQEKDELAVRILLEEGKMNLVLRILHKYKLATYQPNWTEQIKSTADKYNSDVKTVTDRCRVFEQSIGILLKFVMQHIEALQIIDQPEFISLATLVLKHSISATNNNEVLDGADADKMQHTLVIYYLASLTGKFEDLDEERIMDLIDEQGLLLLFLTYLQSNYQQHSLATLIQATAALNSILASDPYQADRPRFLPNKEGQKALVSLKGLFISELVSKHGIKRTSIQNLWDELTRYEKIVGESTVVPLRVRGCGVQVMGGKQEESKTQH